MGTHTHMYNFIGYICWYDECTCCPYGYHIDLDFVRYCESISKEDKNRTGSIKRRKDRRKQRHSMEVLLGLATPLQPLNETTTKVKCDSCILKIRTLHCKENSNNFCQYLLRNNFFWVYYRLVQFRKRQGHFHHQSKSKM